MKLKITLYLILILLLSACADSAKESKSLELTSTNLAKIWKLADVNAIKAQSKNKNNKNSKPSVKTYYLSFFPDGTGIEITRSKFEEYKWQYDADRNEMTLKKPTGTDILKDIKLSLNNDAYLLSLKNADGKNLYFEVYSEMLKDYKEDPFYTENNSWRIKPTSKESKEQLKSRLKDYVQHYQYLFKSKVEYKNRKVTTLHSRGIIKVYEGAIGFVDKEKIPKDWIELFYDEAQAKEAHQMLVDYMDNKVIKKEVSGDWSGANYEILKELTQKISADI